MTHKEDITYITESTDEHGDTLKIIIDGKSQVPHWNTDTTLKAALALLETVDLKDIAEASPAVQKEALKTVREIEFTLLMLDGRRKDEFEKDSYQYKLFEEFQQDDLIDFDLL